MNKQIVYMFSGQGSQYYQMGRELYEHHEQFRYWMDHCDEMVFPLIRTSLVDVLYGGKGKGDPFDNILYTNPALLCIQYSMFKILKEMGVRPHLLMGYSLGELIAMVVSGVVSLEDGIRLVVGIARLAEEKTRQAKMLAIMSSTGIMADFPDMFRDCRLTGTNFQENFVVCGSPGTIQHLQSVLNEKNITSQILPVNYGFHTEFIDPIREECKHLAGGVKLSPAGTPTISALKTGVVREPDGDYLWEVLRYPVNFEQTVRKMLNKGTYVFIDLGPSGSLSIFVKYILPPGSGSVSLQTINQFGRDLSGIEKLRTVYNHSLSI